MRQGRFFKPELTCFFEHQTDDILPEPLASLNNGAGCNEGPVTRQKNVHMGDQLGHGVGAEQGHAGNRPDHHLHGEATLTQSDDAGVSQALINQFRRKQVCKCSKLLR
ncbi:Uncharacterised protein [Serratia quinivorans]|nr:Uncharacterised protein [Serratia quinivorans]